MAERSPFSLKKDIESRSSSMTPPCDQGTLAATILRDSPVPALRKLSIQETHASVMILGRVPSYYLKQVAQEAIMGVLEGRSLVNRVTVVAN